MGVFLAERAEMFFPLFCLFFFIHLGIFLGFQKKNKIRSFLKLAVQVNSIVFLWSG